MGRDIEPYGFVIMGVEPLDCSGSGADANSEFGVRNSEFKKTGGNDLMLNS